MQNSVENLDCFELSWYKKWVSNTRSCETAMEFHAASRFMQFYLCSTTDLHLHHKTFEEKNKIHNIHVFPARCVKYCSLHRATKQLHLLPKVHSLPSKTFDQFSSVFIFSKLLWTLSQKLNVTTYILRSSPFLIQSQSSGTSAPKQSPQKA